MTRRLLPPAPLHLALGVLLLWLPVNVWAAVDSAIAWEAAGYLLFGVALYAAAIAWPPFQRRPVLLAWLLVAGAAALALIGPLIAAQDNAWPLIGPLQRLAAPVSARLGESINPNILAGALVVLLPLVLALALPRRTGQVIAEASGRWRWVGTVLLLAVALLLAAAIMLSGSRGAQLALGASLLLWLYLRWPTIVWATPLLLIAAAALIDQIDPAALLDSAGTGSAVGGLDERMEIWSRALYALQDFSFTGIGIGHFNQVIPLLYPYFLIAPSVDIPHAHNIFLQVGVDLGMPGLVAWLAIGLVTFVVAARSVRRPANADAWALAAGVLGGMVALLVHGQVDAALWGTKLAFIPWLLLALAVFSMKRP
jgi:putative inorganic carbon (HCO3(-)) transporter